MSINLISRRRFLVVCAGFLCPISFGGCQSQGKKPQGSVKITKLTALKEGVSHFPLELVAIYKSGDTLRALSLTCTHQRCPVFPENDAYVCKCHGSRFSNEGRVLTGPATVDLPWLPVEVNAQGDVLVRFDV